MRGIAPAFQVAMQAESFFKISRGFFEWREAETVSPAPLKPQPWVMAQAIFLTLVIGLIDYCTGYEVSVFLFYSVPIILAVSLADKEHAIFIALFCALVWWWADLAAGHPYVTNWHQAWETGIRLVFFLLVVMSGSALKARIELVEHTRRLEQEILRISEREQQRIGQDLHDGICQYYAAVGYAAGTLKQNLESHCPEMAMKAGELAGLIMDGVAQTRGLARGLLPVENDEAGLQSALHELAKKSSRLLGIECDLDSDEPVPISDNARATHLFRIAQESLHNACKHGGAKSVTLGLHADAVGTITLSIADDGTGFQLLSATARSGDGLGLRIMQYRAREIGGQFAVVTNCTGGATVSCVVPR